MPRRRWRPSSTALLGARRPRVLVVAMLADKDADGVLRGPAPRTSTRAVATADGQPAGAAGGRARRARRGVGLEAVVEPDPVAALARARAERAAGTAPCS